MSQLNFTPIDTLIDKYNSQPQQSASITITKEGEPITISTETNRKQEVQFAENEPNIEDREVKENKNEPTLSPELKKAGLNVIDSSSLDPKHRVILPISDDKVLEGLDKPITSSWRWLAEFARFFLVQGHISLKKIHGKVVRVIQR
jgi:hypothetical protein